MLYYITNPLKHDDFKKHINEIENVYWPEDSYNKYKSSLPSWDDAPKKGDRLKEIEEKLNEITEEICNEPIYPCAGRGL